MVKPITPKEAIQEAKAKIPPEVVEVFNDLIVKNMDQKGSARIPQSVVVAALQSKLAVERSRVFSSGWLDVEDTYREVGWSVRYDKHCSDSYFIFSKPTNYSPL